ncbi:ParB N-terminal domain-containing protein [Domibacillus robiginosus]|uniref:ParB N-terminal domain-containing protein n=1 Tax=Domibacillus robiginosus TaxID=1071054 RepID=UPI00067B8D4D|nr:ParB N-terminal domain-containing protein [Domibacillus robiginosus]
MAHKITLTGKPVSALRLKKDFCTFDMEEKGSPAAPKGLPKSSTITYTIFINQKQLKKAGLTEENIQNQKIMVQGEPTLDVPMDDCPGEIGVTCFQVSVISEKQKEEVKAEKKLAKEPEKKEEVKAEEQPKAPEGTEDFVELEQIKVPEEFLKYQPNPYKTQLVIDHVKQSGMLDEPITINRETKVLTDGYRRYIVAEKLEIKTVPVMYEKITVES